MADKEHGSTCLRLDRKLGPHLRPLPRLSADFAATFLDRPARGVCLLNCGDVAPDQVREPRRQSTVQLRDLMAPCPTIAACRRG